MNVKSLKISVYVYVFNKLFIFKVICFSFKYAAEMASCNGAKDTTCHWMCKDANFSMRLFFRGIGNEAIISSATTCSLNINETSLCQVNSKSKKMKNYNCNVTCDNFEDNYCIYTSITFWGFVLLMSLGNIGFNVSNCISDAICFDVLGK